MRTYTIPVCYFFRAEMHISVKYKVFMFSINFEGERKGLHGCIVKLPRLRL